MSDPLGLSIGTTNLVAARVGSQPVIRRSTLPRAGEVLSGFVERVGDPVPLVGGDGSSHRADLLMVEALDAMVAEAGSDVGAQIAVAVPAHWNGATLRSLRDAMRTTPSLAPNGVPVRLVSDAVAALTALGANPGLPVRGVVALLDFGGGGTSITLADATASFEPVDTTRLTDFSGEQIDQSLLALVLDEIADEVDPAGTAAVGSLARLREECRLAKEQLSDEPTADVHVDLPGQRTTVRITRDQLDAMMDVPLAAVLAELRESLQRNRINASDVSAVVAVGGGARIPLVTSRLIDDFGDAFVTTPHPALDAAVGAALFAAYGADADAQTGVAASPLITGAWTARTEAVAPDSSAFRALAWSQDDDTVGDPAPYTGEDPYADPYADSGTTRVVAQYHPRSDDEPRSWLRLPQLLVGVAAVVALVAVGGVAIALTSATDETKPEPTTVPITATSPPAPPPTSVAAPPPAPTTQPPAQNVVTATNEPPPPPPPSTETVTVERPVTTTTTQPTTTTTTTTPTTTTTTPTTTTTTTTTTPTMTTSYITVPFVPVPIPIQVPATPTPTPAPYAPNPYAPYAPPVYQQPQQLPY
ncbi:Hsp70 family protein [Mycobacterium sp. NPDC006124]|uniref:Hsp70 family protein n=1 Tax=Mycobacterium sp. NPDC006124 TaxID=3156729 RepID=UPI00339F7032